MAYNKTRDPRMTEAEIRIAIDTFQHVTPPAGMGYERELSKWAKDNAVPKSPTNCVGALDFYYHTGRNAAVIRTRAFVVIPEFKQIWVYRVSSHTYMHIIVPNDKGVPPTSNRFELIPLVASQNRRGSRKPNVTNETRKIPKKSRKPYSKRVTRTLGGSVVRVSPTSGNYTE